MRNDNEKPADMVSTGGEEQDDNARKEDDAKQSTSKSLPPKSLKKGTVLKKSHSCDAIVFSKSSKQKKKSTKRDLSDVVPKFNQIGKCTRCKSDSLLDESISCKVCKTLFHAICREKTGNVSSGSICTKTFLDSFRPIMAKYGANSNRWGNFMFVCPKCVDSIQTGLTGNKSINNTAHEAGIACSTMTDPMPINTNHVKEYVVSSAGENEPIVSQQNGSKSDVSSKEIVDQMKCMLNEMRVNVLADVEKLISNKLLKNQSVSSEYLTSSECDQLKDNSSVSLPLSPDLTLSVQSEGNSMFVHDVTMPSQSLASSDGDPDISFSLNQNTAGSVGLPNLTESTVIPTTFVEALNKPKPASTPLNILDATITVEESTPSTLPPTPKVTEVIKEYASSYPLAKSQHSTEEDFIIILNATGVDINIKTLQSKVETCFTKIPVKFMKMNEKYKRIVISVASAEHKTEGQRLLQQFPEVVNGHLIISEAKKMFPKVTVANIPNYLVAHVIAEESRLTVPEYREKLKSVLLAKILQKNSFVNNAVVNQKRTFQIIYVNVGHDSTTIGIKVSPDIRHSLLSDQWIYIGNTRCRVVDRFDIKQCFKCQKIGHISTNCTENDFVCMYCSASHQTRSCPYKNSTDTHRCINCSHSTNAQHRDLCNTHHSGAGNCPIIIQEKCELKKKTEYSKNM